MRATVLAFSLVIIALCATGVQQYGERLFERRFGDSQPRYNYAGGQSDRMVRLAAQNDRSGNNTDNAGSGLLNSMIKMLGIRGPYGCSNVAGSHKKWCWTTCDGGKGWCWTGPSCRSRDDCREDARCTEPRVCSYDW
jgi:hypothetical protein